MFRLDAVCLTLVPTVVILALTTGGCPQIATPTDGQTPPPPLTLNEIADSLASTPPIAAAGADQTAAAGATILLNGTGSSDPDGRQLFYVWQQTAGEPTVEFLSTPYASITRFVAPTEITTPALLRFSLTVGDGFAATVDEVTVLVNPAE